MSKYNYDLGNNTQTQDIESVFTKEEKVLWRGNPKKSAFIINRCLIMFPIAVIWMLFDGFMIAGVISSMPTDGMWINLVFFAFHLVPVWIWLGNVLTARKRWANTQYAVTDKRIIIQSGFIGMDYKSLFYKDISNVYLKVGIIDRLLGVGDIYFDTNIASVFNSSL